MRHSAQELPWPRIRELVVDMMALGHRTHLIHATAEIDVSRALDRIDEYRPRIPGGLSFTAFIAYCLGRAVAQHPVVHAHRRGRRKLIAFDDVDVNVLFEKRKPDGALIPVFFLVRGANQKSLAQINQEMRVASRSDLYDDAGVAMRRRIVRLPRPARRAIWWWLRRDPARRRQLWGTVGLTNVGAFLGARPTWGIPISFGTCALTVGATYEAVRWVDGRAQPRRTLCVTVTLDHDIVDGGPAARFGETLARLIESAAGLDETLLDEAGALSEAAALDEVAALSEAADLDEVAALSLPAADESAQARPQVETPMGMEGGHR